MCVANWKERMIYLWDENDKNYFITGLKRELELWMMNIIKAKRTKYIYWRIFKSIGRQEYVILEKRYFFSMLYFGGWDVLFIVYNVIYNKECRSNYNTTFLWMERFEMYSFRWYIAFGSYYVIFDWPVTFVYKTKIKDYY